MQPTVDTLAQIVEAAGSRLRVEAHPDHTASVVGLARSIQPDVAAGDYIVPVRKAAELAARFASADKETMITARPPETGDPRWDAFVGGSLSGWPCGRVCRLRPGSGRTTGTCAAAGGSRRWSRCVRGSTRAARCRSRAAGCTCTASRSPTCSGPGRRHAGAGADPHAVLRAGRRAVQGRRPRRCLHRGRGSDDGTIAYHARPATRDVDGMASLH